MPEYHIESVHTNYYSDGKESTGNIVVAVLESDFNPSTTVRIGPRP